MKKYYITQHPVKVMLEFDDDFLHSVGVSDSDIEDMVAEMDANLEKMALLAHAKKAQLEASRHVKDTTD